MANAQLKYWDVNTNQYLDIISAAAGTPGPTGPTGAAGVSSFAQVTTAAPTARGVGDLWVDSDATLLSWDDVWMFPTVMVNGWVDAPGYQTLRFRKLPGDLVTIQGSVKSGNFGYDIFSLPAGYSPSAVLRFVVASTGGPATVEVFSGGSVRPYNTYGSATNALLSLDGITFRAGA